MGRSPVNAGSPSAPGMSAPVNPYVLAARLTRILKEDHPKKKFIDFLGVTHLKIQNEQSSDSLEISGSNRLQQSRPIKRHRIGSVDFQSSTN